MRKCTTICAVCQKNLQRFNIYSLLAHIFIDKRQGHQVFDAVDAVDAARAVEQDAHGLLVAVFDFENNLPTASAGRHGVVHQPLGIAGSDGERGDGLVGLLRLRCKNGRPLGTQARWEGGILTAYTFLVLAETIFIRQPFIGQHFQPQLFWSWRVWAVQKEQILTNVIMFELVGVLVGWIWSWKGLWFAAGLSVGIEILQLITARGLCEFDDVFHNMIGAVIGVGVMVAWKRIQTISRNNF